MLTVAEALESVGRRYGDKPALIYGDSSLTFVALDRRTNQWAHALRAQGIGPGDRVGLLLANGLEMAEAYFGVAKAGAVGVPINLRWTPGEMAYALHDADVRLLITSSPFGSGAQQAAPAGVPVFFTDTPGGEHDWAAVVDRAAITRPEHTPLEQDPWVLVYTSGTTGKPKGALRSHYSNLIIALVLVAELGISSEDVGMALLPMFHVNSMWFVTLSVAIGASCVIYPHRTFYPQQIIGEIQRHQVTYSMFVPSLLTFLADAVEHGQLQPDSLKVIMSASATLDGRLRDRILQGFSRSRLYDIYGATEYGACTIVRHRVGGPLGVVGYATLGQEIKILDPVTRDPLPVDSVGEIFVRGPSLMTEYFRLPEANEQAFTEDGFLTVGDMGRIDQSGMLTLVERIQDLIIVAGENVYPAEVEGALMEHPQVAGAVAVGLPDSRRGQRVAAMVVLREGQEVSERELKTWCEGRLADFKRPSHIDRIDQLPLGPTGKVVRRLAREILEQRYPNLR